MSDQVTLTIDGKEVSVPKGTRVIEAAKQVDIDIPFYCYHPGLSVAGNCRMCLVEIEKMPKLQIACHTMAQDGMVVNTANERVKETRKHVLEFLLVNHPVDCPVCDQAGECWLQDYYLNYGAYQSRLNENKIKKKKAQSIGPHVMLDQERCILCSRCVRFTDEVSKTNELGIGNRGDHSEIALFPETELDNPYSGNVVDICPVGALTDKDFRFKMRVWYLKSEDTLCNGCSRGCNIQMHYRTDRQHHAKGERVIRLKPRYNEQVNQWWMCDEGRYSYKVHDQNRLTEPVKRSPEPQVYDWQQSLSEVSLRLAESRGQFAVLLSPQLSNEELYLAKKLFADELESKKVILVSPNKPGFEDDILIRADKNPNTKGAEYLGLKQSDQGLQEILKLASSGEIKGLVIFGQDLMSLHDSNEVQQSLSQLQWSLFIGSNHHLTAESTTYLFPSATYAEKEGTFTNFEGITQKFNRVLDPLGEALPEWKILVRLAAAMNIKLSYEETEEIFKDLTKEVSEFKASCYEDLKTTKTNMRDMAMPMIPELEQDSKLIFYAVDEKQPKAEQPEVELKS